MTYKIPASRVIKTELYINTAKMTPAQILKATGAQAIINAGFFDMKTFKSNCSGLTAHGVKYTDGYFPGYAFNGKPAMFTAYNSVGRPHYIGGFPVLIKDGAVQDFKEFKKGQPAVGGSSARSAIGYTADGTAVLYCDKAAISLETLAARMLAEGCVTAINLDGGGSTQGIFDTAGKVTSSRKVYSCILFRLEPRPTVKKGSRSPAAVRLAQELLNAAGAKLEADGKFGPLTDAAMRAYQKANGLAADGICGPKTWAELEG